MKRLILLAGTTGLLFVFSQSGILEAQQAQNPPVPPTKPRPSATRSKAQTATTKKSEPVSKALTNDDIIAFVKAGFGEDFIADRIKSGKTNFSISTSEVLRLKNEGVSERIIQVMIDPTKPLPPEVKPLPETPSPKTRPRAAEIVQPQFREIKIPDGTEVKLRLLKSISSGTANVDDNVEFENSLDVIVGGVIVIQKGALGSGRVIEAKSKKSFGRSGKLNFTIDKVKCVDGQNIRLRSARERKGDESYGKAGVITILFGPFGALVKGKDVVIPAGTEFTIYIDEDKTIKLKSVS